MTTFIFDTVWGTNSLGRWAMTTDSFAGYALDDADDAIAMMVSLPYNGVITHVGFHVTSIAGTPPNYNVGLCTVNEGTGAPTTTPYGGSAITTYVPSGAGWAWVQLATPASGIMGDFVAVHIYPTASAPNSTNRITITNESSLDNPMGYPNRMNFATSWNSNNPGYSYWAIKWNDGKIYGIPVISKIRKRIAGDTTPNELGCKFTLPVGVTCVGPFIEWVVHEANVTMNINLYDSDNNRLRSLYIPDADKLAGTAVSVDRQELRWSSPVTLNKDATYRLTIEILSSGAGISIPTIFLDYETRTNCTIMNMDRWYGTERTASGAWTDYDNRISSMGIHISEIDVTTSGAGTIVGGSYAYVN